MKKFSYQFFVSCLFSICCFLHIFTETQRIFPQFQFTFTVCKIVFGVIGFAFSIYFYLFETTDLVYFLLMVTLNIYTLIFMWLAPLYEISYLQISIGSAFFTLKRNWLFPFTFGFGFLGILINYHLQDKLNWALPPVNRSDWLYIIVIFFSLSWIIQKYSIGNFKAEQDRLNRFSIIGFETTRLLHDIKGLLSTPLLILENIKNRHLTFTKEEYAEQANTILQDLEHIRKVLFSLNILVVNNNKIEPVNIGDSLTDAIVLLEKRLKTINLKLPENRLVDSNPNILQSMFFNLLLNSIEAFERNGTLHPTITIDWSKDVLIYEDNAGNSSEPIKSPEKNKINSGIGLKIVAEDLRKAGAKFEMRVSLNKTVFKIKFLKVKSLAMSDLKGFGS